MALSSQEWGRAGRDGAPARCVLLYSYHDKGRVEGLIRRSPNELPSRLERLLQVLPLTVLSRVLTIAAPWVYIGYTMGLLWVYFGFTMGIL